MGGGIFTLRRPRPYRRHGGEGDATLTIIYAHAGINRNGGWVDNDAARRVATSSEKRENRFETAAFQRESAAKGP